MPTKPKNEIVWLEIPIFIHGMTPRTEARSHKVYYDNLLARVNKALTERGKRPLSQPVRIEWGWDSSQSKQPDRYLAEAEEKIWQDISASIAPKLNPLVWLYNLGRSLMTFAVGDMFYYASADGEAALREHVFEQLAAHIKKMARTSANISLTIFAHSGGSLVMHDLLYHLFGEKDFKKSEGEALYKIMQPIRKLSKGGRLRIRRFYTFGSPIYSLSLRSNTLMVKKIIAHESLQPAEIGLTQDDSLPGTRWINFWSRFDAFSYPVKPLYFEDTQWIEDRHITTQLIFPASHSAYWDSKKMARMIAENY